MTRPIVGLLHAGYWTLYGLLLVVLLFMLRAPHAGPPLAGIAATWPVLLLAVVPNIVAFYAGYGLLFGRLARRELVATIAGGAVACAAAAATGLALAYVLFGPGQPAFSKAGELAGVAVSFFALAAIHLSIALVMRGFVGWHELTLRTHNMELALVRSRLDPHFLFNSLNNIDVLMARDPGAASEYLKKLSGILRYVLYDTRGNEIPLGEELGYIDKYVALEQIRTRSARRATHQVVGDPAGLSIAPMTFIPFIENAFKHTEGIKDDGAITSRIVIDGRRVVFECSNKFRSDVPATTAAGGLGNDLIQKRLALLYRNRHSLEAAASNGVYNVRLTIDA
jgi:two-component system, LytTR family, sensor kinase